MPADLDMRGKAFGRLIVTTAAASKVILPPDDVSISHDGFQDDARLASDATDYVQVVPEGESDPAGGSPAGEILEVIANDVRNFNPADLATGSNGIHEIKLLAFGHNAVVSILRGRLPRR